MNGIVKQGRLGVIGCAWRVAGLFLAGLAQILQPTSIAQPVSQQMYGEMRWRLVGPYRAGWATVGTGVAREPDVFYIGTAGGGVWKTSDAGETWQGLMLHERSSSIGALAVAPSDPKTVYAGTGQVDLRYDMQSGDGVYRSNDGGLTWTRAGLDSTRQIGCILVDPGDARRVLVAALGPVFGPGTERGVFLSTDGGTSWSRTLFVDDETGAVDLASDPLHPSVVYAATWQVRVRPWLDYFEDHGGPGSGMYKSEDGGMSWKRLGGGLPTGLVGRIGIAVARGSESRIIYATVEAPHGKSGLYYSDDSGEQWTLVNPDRALASSYFSRLAVDPRNPKVVYCMGRSISKSTDGGRHFDFFRGAPGGDDYHHLWINPDDPTHMITSSDQGAVVTVNGGASWSNWYNQPTGQFYRLSADDQFPYRIYSGQQDNGTVGILSRGPYGVIEDRDWHPVGADERDYDVPKPGNPDIVFGSGLGGTVTRFDEATRQSADVSPWPAPSYGTNPAGLRFRYTWLTPLVFSPRPPHAMYLGAQVLLKSTDDGDSWQLTSPDLSGAKAGSPPCEHPDLSRARDCGLGVIFSIAPSPLSGDVIWVGTDDGLIQRTADGGTHWTNVTPDAIPLWGRIDAIAASAFSPGAAYAAVDLHRLGRRTPLILKTDDGGTTWRTITSGLPGDEYTTAVRADPVRKGLLYAATNCGAYVSFNDGDAWEPLSLNLPTVCISDLLVHDGDLIASTEGRGIWILDDVAPLREISEDLTRTQGYLFTPAKAWRLRANENRDTPWPPGTPLGQNPPPGAVIDYWVGAGATGPVTLMIQDGNGKIVRRWSSEDPVESLPSDRYFEEGWVGTVPQLAGSPGMHRFVWDLRYSRPPALRYHFSIAGIWLDGTPLTPEGPLVVPGKYRVTLSVAGKEYSRSLSVELDPRVHVAPEVLTKQLAMATAIDADLARGFAAHSEISAELGKTTNARPSSIADSLGSISDKGRPSLRSVMDILTQLATRVQEADAAPTDGQREVFAEYDRQLDKLLARWQKIQALEKSVGGR